MRIIRLLIVVLLASVAYAQNTTVTGTIKDLNGNLYANGTVSANQLTNLGVPAFHSGVNALNSSGVFSIIVPSGTYTFTFCAKPVNIGPTTNPTPGVVCFTTSSIVVSGGSQDISTAANANAAQLGPSLGNGAGAVSSVFTRIGAVVAVSGDYIAAQITNAYDVSTNQDIGAHYTTSTESVIPNGGGVTQWNCGMDSTLHFFVCRNSAGTLLNIMPSGFTAAANQIKAPLGSAGAPSYSFGADNTGVYSAGAGNFDIALGGTSAFTFNSLNLQVASGGTFHFNIFPNSGSVSITNGGVYSWSSTTNSPGGGLDTALARLSAGIVSVGNGSGTSDVSSQMALAGIRSNNASNTDLSGELAFAAATTGSYTFVKTYTSHPECMITPQFNLGANTMWITYTSTTSFTINTSGAVTGSFSYICAGRN